MKKLLLAILMIMAVNAFAQDPSSEESNSSGIDLDVQVDFIGGVGVKKPIPGAWGIEMGFGFLSPKKINALGVAAGYMNIIAKGATSHNIPIYAYDRLYFSSHRTSPYIDFALGGNVCVKSETKEGNGKVGGAMLLRSGLGLAIDTKSNLAVHLKVGYQLMYNKAAGHSIYFAIGFGSR